MYIDFDGFKQINDDLGHNYGDKVIQEVAAHLKDMYEIVILSQDWEGMNLLLFYMKSLVILI
ncbi:MAG: diguanylate cyclase [Gammaproteobacteria bacterium]|nr:diguanylate cyclase [Gammaproteobacteria bacterium]